MPFHDDLLNRYLQAVGSYLPAASKDDTLAELRANLEAQIEAREEETGTPLANDEVAAILKAHGRPVLVAARYLPQRQLIGPTVFPFYWMTLRRAFPFVLLIYAVARSATILFHQEGSDLVGAIARAIFQFPPVLITFWAVVTLVFAAIEYAQTNGGVSANSWTKWDPHDLPPVSHEDKANRPEPMANRVADCLFHCFLVLYVLAVPSHPYLILGPGGGYLDRVPVGLSPEWHVFYLVIVALLIAQIAAKFRALFVTTRRAQEAMGLVTQAISTVTAAVLVSARMTFIPKSPTVDLASLATVNYAVNLGFKIALLASVTDLLWRLSKFFRGRMGTAYLALP
ncbi:hypothetical protein [Granulicella sibirica]|uniref:Putative membrane protein n=1 Tax=Granulicella sibirica TaxID=2479048 RepID=A0A4Q0T8B5_9BACT|nr:hypothetical protein [Granulicella sibirica]RXH57956.1 putative membrane protein [Granulicella sibirica]